MPQCRQDQRSFIICLVFTVILETFLIYTIMNIEHQAAEEAAEERRAALRDAREEKEKKEEEEAAEGEYSDWTHDDDDDDGREDGGGEERWAETAAERLAQGPQIRPWSEDDDSGGVVAEGGLAGRAERRRRHDRKKMMSQKRKRKPTLEEVVREGLALSDLDLDLSEEEAKYARILRQRLEYGTAGTKALDDEDGRMALEPLTDKDGHLLADPDVSVKDGALVKGWPMVKRGQELTSLTGGTRQLHGGPLGQHKPPPPSTRSRPAAINLLRDVTSL